MLEVHPQNRLSGRTLTELWRIVHRDQAALDTASIDVERLRPDLTEVHQRVAKMQDLRFTM